MQARFVPVTKAHPVINAEFKLKPADFAALELRVGCKKVNVLILLKNISCPLNGDLDVQDDLERARKVATNILAWALRKRSANKKLDETELVKAQKPVTLTADQVKRLKAQKSLQFKQAFGRLKHRGSWTSSPLYFSVLKAVLNIKESLPKLDGEVYVSPNSNDLFQSAMLFITGYDDPRLSDSGIVNLRTYLQSGGSIMATAACSHKDFDKGFRKLMKKVLPNDSLEKIPLTSSVYKQPFNLHELSLKTTKAYKQRYKDKIAPLWGIRRNKRWIVIYNPVDMVTDISTSLDEMTTGYRKSTAAMISVNIMNYIMTP